MVVIKRGAVKGDLLKVLSGGGGDLVNDKAAAAAAAEFCPLLFVCRLNQKRGGQENILCAFSLPLLSTAAALVLLSQKFVRPFYNNSVFCCCCCCEEADDQDCSLFPSLSFISPAQLSSALMIDDPSCPFSFLFFSVLFSSFGFVC